MYVSLQPMRNSHHAKSRRPNTGKGADLGTCSPVAKCGNPTGGAAVASWLTGLKESFQASLLLLQLIRLVPIFREYEEGFFPAGSRPRFDLLQHEAFDPRRVGD
ncbi:hypothetical protein M404DRAFT_8738 [Pisolithus tinctorius Marx 270]|uniref:Uncharacterized protein n=1 Tax=Pisolithus tinctorius Marx 270 TaxID=870435 RepID=A0A0C3PFY0_PISTI|nr:hypothetical protein M404DRAFT_8738 [Pisolithus tinctorius Marx 270]